MRIGYFEPLTRAWERMKSILWQPFDLAKWLVLGFSAWLAGLADGAGGGGGKYVFDDGDVFSELTEDWDFVSISETRLELKDISDDGTEDILVFERK